MNALVFSYPGDPRYVGECPECGESFRLKDSGLFYSDQFTPEGRIAKQSLDESLKELLDQLKRKKEEITKGAPKKSIEVNVGKIVEKIAPILPGFPYHINDCRFLAEPIDYMVFSGLAKKRSIDEVVFMDIKTGRANLNPHQKQIQDAIGRKKVELELY